MSKKIYPNDPCPCGSGKKYKNCCGKDNSNDLSSYKRSDLQMEDFVKELLYEDIEFLGEITEAALGPVGYNYCMDNVQILDENFHKNELWDMAANDVLGIYDHLSKLDPDDFQSKKISPYGGGVPDQQEDILSLSKKGFFPVKSHQIELFHAYLMFNLNKRFNEYFYLPTDDLAKQQRLGPIAHRGYDFLLAITIYFEIQLGVHVYLNKLDLKEWKNLYGKDVVNYFNIQNFNAPDGMLFFLHGYQTVLTKISSRFSHRNEIKLYKQIGAYTDDAFQLYISLLNQSTQHAGTNFDYLEYLQNLVPAICLDDPQSTCIAECAFPQCDFIKYHNGLMEIQQLFEENFESKIEDPSKDKDTRTTELLKNLSYDLKPFEYTKKDLYDDAVFNMTDELNGNLYSKRPETIEYVDFPDITCDEYDKNGYAIINPARKIARPSKMTHRKLRMELYQMFNGRMFDLFEAKAPGDFNYDKKNLVGRYPILPWLSSGNENTLHVPLFDENRTYVDLFSEDVNLRQQRLQMEIRLTKIPVNCIDEFLIPDVYYNWDKLQESMKEIEEKNDKLEEDKKRLQRQNDLNAALVESVSHTCVNYLNPDKLIETGMELRNANCEYPDLEKIHTDGDILLLQSEQENYMTRQLSSLSWRCNSNLKYLSERFRDGLTTSGGISILAPVGFALKSLIARVLFQEQNKRVNHIRKNLDKTEEEWISIKDSFIQDILANNGSDDTLIFNWWNSHIGILNIKISDLWDKIQLLSDMPFYDLIVEIITEQILNALSHGNLSKAINIEFGEEKRRGNPFWAYIQCENTIGEKFSSGHEKGISSLRETLLMLNDADNNENRGLDIINSKEKNGIFISKAWIWALYLRTR